MDIDLTYLPVRDRAESLAEINETLDRITAAANGGILGLDARRIAGRGGGATRIRARLKGDEVKIETSPVMRGVVHDPEQRDVMPAVEDEFGYASIQVVSFEDPVRGQAPCSGRSPAPTGSFRREAALRKRRPDRRAVSCVSGLRRVFSTTGA
ncbi:nucleotidyl transferase AbiEii/AbiGii toxin family protein [Rhizobium ruizarguesonis]|uniref:nucleotidyl transferase AbiEii/AbiGii toxin family protein n=1 Tax=Rhizobium ruizarguesonis TaxID=2081791 RepID=UPI0013EE6174|nr:nucleotidyl transferase AbiEii/AbiGii toxin family protein [Rhizobium ruizarguesonis]